jgi:hypothetical protein
MSTTRVPGISHSPAESIRIEDGDRRVTYIPAGQGPVTTVSTDPHIARAERVSTEPRSDADLGTVGPDGRRRRFGVEGGKKQSILIVLREFMFTAFVGLTVGTVFATYGNYNVLAVGISLCVATVLIQMVDTVLLHYAGLSWKKAVMWNFLWNALMWGTVAAGRALGATGVNGVCYLFAAEVGVFLYLVLVHLFPAIVKGKKYDLKSVYLLDFLIGTYVIFAIRAIES